MKIRYFSDFHLELIKPHKVEKRILRYIPSGLDEICILAGDIGNPYHSNYDVFMKFISKHFKKTFVIPGNHEYYQKTKTIQETNEFMENYFQQFPTISFLNNKFEIYEHHCFIGTTLWSHITRPQYEINDVHEISQFDYVSYNTLHGVCVDFLQHALKEHENCVVITHHVPSNLLIDIKYKTPDMVPYNQWFSCDMDELIQFNKDKIKCWVYGHTHTPSITTIHEIPFLCNPIGYPNENKLLNYHETVKIEAKM
jgi:predicted phosphodiesterase